MANQVTLTFGGDPAGAKKAMDEVGDSAQRMKGHVEESASGFARAGEAADEVDTKAMGFRDTLTGVQDSLKGVSLLAKGPSFEGFLTLGAGIGDLGSGFYNFLIPALEKTKLATLAQAAASKGAAVGTNIWTGAQRLLSLAFISSPIGWIVLGVAALVAVIVLIATKTHWFQNIWRVSWSGIKVAASATWDFIKKIPGWIGSAFAGIGRAISWPFRTAFNLISDAWNATVGGLHFTIPGWVPGIGGNSFGVPRLPHFHSGGVVPGMPGQPVPVLALGGERFAGGFDGAAGGALVTVKAGDVLVGALLDMIKSEVQARGGDPREVGIRVA